MFTIDFTSRVPIYEQICNNVIRLASAGVFKSGDRLPPVRTVAKEIGVNPNTVLHMGNGDLQLPPFPAAEQVVKQ